MSDSSHAEGVIHGFLLCALETVFVGSTNQERIERYNNSTGQGEAGQDRTEHHRIGLDRIGAR